MTDTPVAPPEAAPSSNLSQPNHNTSDVVINQSQPDIPNPIGPQAPPRDSARESILKAFERAQSPPPKTGRPEKPAPKAAEAKAGHNQPPEQTPPEKLDLKKRPDDQPQPRGDRGQFAPRVNGEVRSNAVNSGQPDQKELGMPGHDQNAHLTNGQNQAASEYKQLPPHAPYAEPPQRICRACQAGLGGDAGNGAR